MLLRYFYDDRLAQASYLLGCVATGEALVIDPMRHIQPYLDTARQEGLRVTHVTETHIHADYVSGARELAAATGASLLLSAMGTPDWQYAFAGEAGAHLLRDGDHFMVGRVRVEVLHTPGHTPEHICFLVTDSAGADRPIGLFTGDFIFVGDVGRPDLLEEAAGQAGTKLPAARDQFRSLRRIEALPDYLQVWPGHGAGSACGKALGAMPSSTLGYERLFNPAFQFTEEAAFAEWLLSEQPEAPRYFAQMKRVNRQGPALLATLNAALSPDRAALDDLLRAGAVVADLRARDDYAAAHVAGTLSIPMSSRSFVTYLGWLMPYERPAAVILPDARAYDDVIVALRSIGLDHVEHFFTADVVRQREESLPTVTTAELAAMMDAQNVLVLDVRGEAEYCEQHIVGAQHVMVGRLPLHLAELPQDRPIVTQCASGYRSQIAASVLRAHGFDRVYPLRDGQALWAQALPTASCPSAALRP